MHTITSVAPSSAVAAASGSSSGGASDVPLAQFAGPALEGGVPFLSDAPLTGAYLGWVALWVALALGLTAVSFGRRDL